MYTINWRGDNCKNFYNKRLKPIGFCDHITAGTRGSVYYWFNSPNNTVGSSHYVVCRDGSIDQYVQLDKSAWTQGISASDGGYDRAIAPIVRDNKGINPNYYLIGIEYEGYVEGHQENGETVVVNFGLDGSITEEQFYAGCWLKKFLQGEVEKKWNYHIPLARYNLEQHRRIDPKRKPFCPGNNFPVERQLKELAIAESMTLEAYEERLLYLQTPSSNRAICYAFTERIETLGNTFTNPKYGELAKSIVMRLEPILGELGYKGEVTPEGIVRRIVEIYKHSHEAKFEGEAFYKLTIGAKFAQENGIMPSL